MTNVMERTEDIYEVVVRLTETNQIDEAIRKITEIEYKFHEIELLNRLARDLELDLTLAIAHAHDLAIAIARNLDRDLTIVLTIARDLARDLTLVRARARDLDLTLAIAIVRARARDLDRALAHASILAIARANVLARDLARAKKFNFVILGVLERDTLDISFQEQSITLPSLQEQFVRLEGVEIMTPHSLSTQITPYLQALFDLQGVVNRLTGQEITQPRIVSISQNSPIQASTDGIPDAIRLVRETVVPWRRRNARELAVLDIKEKEAEIALLEADRKAKAAQLRQEKKLSEIELEQEKIALEQQKADLESSRLAIEEQRLKVHREKINMALDIITRLAPNLSEADRIGYIMELIEPLGILMVESRIEIRD